jgi:hypothetical protein
MKLTVSKVRGPCRPRAIAARGRVSEGYFPRNGWLGARRVRRGDRNNLCGGIRGRSIADQTALLHSRLNIFLVLAVTTTMSYFGSRPALHVPTAERNESARSDPDPKNRRCEANRSREKRPLLVCFGRAAGGQPSSATCRVVVGPKSESREQFGHYSCIPVLNFESAYGGLSLAAFSTQTSALLASVQLFLINKRSILKSLHRQ